MWWKASSCVCCGPRNMMDLLFKPICPEPMVKSVKRCLFGKPTQEGIEAINARMREIEHADALRFETNWGFDILSDNNNTNSDKPYQWTKVPADTTTEVPEFYRKGFRTRKTCKRRLVTCVGKALTFDDYDEKMCGVVGATDVDMIPKDNTTAVPYTVSGGEVEVYLGVRPERSTTPVTTTTSSSSSSSPSPVPSSCICQTPPSNSNSENVRPSARRQLQMTDLFRVRKRARSCDDNVRSQSKRERR